MLDVPICPGCREPLDAISASGRADDLYLCRRCYHSWFAFELQEENTLEQHDRAGNVDEQ